MNENKSIVALVPAEYAAINDIRRSLGLGPCSEAELTELIRFRNCPPSVMNVAYASAILAINDNMPIESFSQAKILVPCVNLLIKNDLRMRVYNDNGLAMKSLKAMPASILGNIIPATILRNTGDPAVVVAAKDRILGFFCVGKPRVTQLGSFEASILVQPTANSQVGTPYTLTGQDYRIKVQGSAVADSNNTGAFFLPLPFKALNLSYDGVVGNNISETSEDNTANIIGLASGGFTVESGDNLHLEVYPIPATKEVQILFRDAVHKGLDTHVELFKLMVESYLKFGNPLQC